MYIFYCLLVHKDDVKHSIVKYYLLATAHYRVQMNDNYYYLLNINYYKLIVNILILMTLHKSTYYFVLI